MKYTQNFIRNWWWEILCLVGYTLLAGYQLFIPPITGMADNGDFPKVLAHLDLCDNTREHDKFFYVYSFYDIDPACHWESGITSSESLFPRVNKQIAEWTGRNRFSVQGAGKGHLLVVLAAFAILLWALHDARPALRFALPPLLLLIFSDVAYVAYLNSFYFDAASMVFLLLATALLVAAALRPGRAWLPIAFALAAGLYVTSKTQHAILGPLLAAVGLCFGLREPGFKAALWIAAAATTLLATAIMFHLTDVDYRVHPLYNLIFYRLTTRWPAGQTLAELGLPNADLKFVGTHSYTPGNPTTDPAWEKQFLTQTSYSKLIPYYVGHPHIAFTLLWDTLRNDGPGLRPLNIGNYRQEDGFSPGALAHRFDAWTKLRVHLIAYFPVHMIIFYAVMLLGSFACLFLGNLAARWPLYPLTLALSIGGIIEFSFSALLDCVENARHLFLFHVITELLIVFAVAAILSRRPAQLRSS
ncbi:MAG TPA: hypothetical protein VGL72_02315 [Bryobacteraceae bacterium]